MAEAVDVLRRRKAKNDFWSYCLYYDPKFFSRRLFLKHVADAFTRVYDSYQDGVIRRLAVSMPPRESVMRNCCSDTLYNKLSYDTRDIVRSSRFKEIFPDIQLRGDKQNVHGWSLEAARQVSYFGAGVGGTVIGFGASMLAMTDEKV